MTLTCVVMYALSRIAVRAALRAAFDVNVTAANLAVDETVILLHPPLHLAGVSIVIERERQQNGKSRQGLPGPSPRPLATSYHRPARRLITVHAANIDFHQARWT